MLARMTSSGTMAVVAIVAVSALGTTVDAAEIVKFRLSKWTSAHFDNAQAATKYLETVNKIGGEATQHQHGDHFDVRYRCPTWRSISCKSHSEAHQLEHWFKSYGFETMHQH